MHCHSTHMEHDARIEAEVAVVGAGPAGIVLALELSAAGRTVVLIESGTLTRNNKVQDLGEAALADEHHVAMALATRRQFGGASNVWGGRCVPLDPVDFEQRRVTGSVAWPIAYRDMAAYYARACEWLWCGRCEFDAENIACLQGRSLVPGFVDGDVRATALERWSLPTNFRRYYDDVRKAALIRLITGMTCTNIICGRAGDAVEYLELRGFGGKVGKVSASRYVLACGGVEATRLLLASDAKHSGGIGNHAGHLGRWYMAHVGCKVAEVAFTTPAKETIYGYERDDDGVFVRRRLTLSQELIMRENLPNAAMWMVNPTIGDASHGNGVLSLTYIALASPLGRRLISDAIRETHVGPDGVRTGRAHLMNIVRDVGPALRFAAAFGWGRYGRRGRKLPGFFVRSDANCYPLMYHGEHLPQCDSRVELTDTRDELGMRRVRTKLRFGDDDVRGAARVHRILDEYLRDLSVGRLMYPEPDLERAIRRQLGGGYHQAGTMRMAARPEDGVVDADLAVHGVSGLYVASSGVFVTSGQANSTLGIVAVAVRLAQHLDKTLGQERRDERRRV